MRPIKFRIWHKDDKQIEPVEEMHWDENGVPWKVETPDSVTEINENHNVLMQFTGLLDKNGKEIFEGDIVKLSCGYVESSPDHSITTTIIYDVDGFRAEKHDKKILVKGGSSEGKTLSQGEIHSWVGMHTCLRERESKLEVIGNIHENPELLTLPK